MSPPRSRAQMCAMGAAHERVNASWVHAHYSSKELLAVGGDTPPPLRHSRGARNDGVDRDVVPLCCRTASL